MSADTLLLGTRKGLLLLEPQGRDWRVVNESYLGFPVSYAATDPRTDILWTCVEHGHWGSKLYRSRDRGCTWDDIQAPKYPEGAEIKPGQPATLTYLWTVVPGHADQPNRVYVGTEPGGLFQSDDGGDSFELVDGLWNHPSRQEGWFGGGRDQPGLCSIIIDPCDSRRMLVGVSVGGVYESIDGGQSWEPRNKGLYASYLPDPHAEVGHDPHLMVASPANPDVLWQQNHCGVFRSTDGAKSWQDVSQLDGPVKFGFPIVVDEHDPDTAWVVPAIADDQRRAVEAALCVCRTEDGGQSWTTLRAGLPQQNSYDLVYRHALDIKGDNLVFGTTTGNVYVSDDRGDSWRAVGHHFPPVYSVRFGA